MDKDIKKTIFSFVIYLLIVLIFPQIIYAFEIKKFPLIPQTFIPSEICEKSKLLCLTSYVTYWINLLIYAAGIIALISFTIGAIQLIMNFSAESVSEGKERIKNSLIGLCILLATFIILRTVNPALVTPTSHPLAPAPGLYFASKNDLSVAPFSLFDTATIPSDYRQLVYHCENYPPLFVWLFPQPGLEEGNKNKLQEVKVVVLKCNSRVSLANVGSYKTQYLTNGVYYFLNDKCEGYMSGAQIRSHEITPPFTSAKSFRIIGPYGVIFHSNPDFRQGSMCTWPVLNLETKLEKSLESCYSINLAKPLSVEIFRHTYPYETITGDKVIFWSDVNGWDSGNKAGKKEIYDEEIREGATNRGFLVVETKNIIFDYTDAGGKMAEICQEKKQETEEKKTCPCRSVKDWNEVIRAGSEVGEGCGGSLQIIGDYFVSFYRKSGENFSCQTFRKNTPNMSTSMTAQEKSKEESVLIIPVDFLELE